MEYNFCLFDFNHFWWFDILAHSTIICKVLCVLVHSVNFAFLLCGNVGFGFVFLLQVEEPFLVWTWYIIQGIFMLCFVCVVTTIVIGVDIGAHNKNLRLFVKLWWKFCHQSWWAMSWVKPIYNLSSPRHARFEMNLLMWLSLIAWLI
jgi:hypothetical protein